MFGAVHRSRLDNVTFGEERAGTEDGPYVFLGTRRGAALSAPALRLEAHIVKTIKIKIKIKIRIKIKIKIKTKTKIKIKNRTPFAPLQNKRRPMSPAGFHIGAANRQETGGPEEQRMSRTQRPVGGSTSGPPRNGDLPAEDPFADARGSLASQWVEFRVSRRREVAPNARLDDRRRNPEQSIAYRILAAVGGVGFALCAGALGAMARPFPDTVMTFYLTLGIAVTVALVVLVGAAYGIYDAVTNALYRRRQVLVGLCPCCGDPILLEFSARARRAGGPPRRAAGGGGGRPGAREAPPTRCGF